MTPLERLIRTEIAATGPMSVARYVELCLGHPRYGYYVTRDPLGADGDFTTAPEVSQMFGEIIGAWVAWALQVTGAGMIVELGPGRGTLMADIRRIVSRAGASPQIWLVETSPKLKAAQARAVPDAQWAESLGDVPAGPAVIVANEFLDALPVRQFLNSAEGWRERQIGLGHDSLVWGLSSPMPGPPAPVGAWREVSEATETVLRQIAARPGAAVLVDYGYTASDRPVGPTLQAVRDHAPCDPLDLPGQADLTWLIDFDRISTILGGEVATQGDFLTSLGIGQRAAALAQAHPYQADAIADALERLTDPAQMGSLFKVATSLRPGKEVT